MQRICTWSLSPVSRACPRTPSEDRKSLSRDFHTLGGQECHCFLLCPVSLLPGPLCARCSVSVFAHVFIPPLSPDLGLWRKAGYVGSDPGALCFPPIPACCPMWNVAPIVLGTWGHQLSWVLWDSAPSPSVPRALSHPFQPVSSLLLSLECDLHSRATAQVHEL